jgi:pyruvate dehydrogenase E1 component
VNTLLEQLRTHALLAGVQIPFSANTPYINTISSDRQPLYPGNGDIEQRIRSLVRWNALAMVVRANREESGIGGHISTFASAATLYEVGFNHFFRGRGAERDGDIIYFQVTLRPAFTRARSLKDGSIRSIWKTFVENCVKEVASPRIRSLADAAFLGIPDRIDGAGSDHGDLSSSV